VSETLKTFSSSLRILAAGILSLAAFIAVRLLPLGAPPRCAEAMIRAARIMDKATLAVREAQDRGGIGIDITADPNRTGLIGPEIGPLMTTIGDLEAKRSTTNPNIAGLLVYLLDRAGVRPGDHIAIGSSGSFPALLVASLAAAKALGIHPVTILSLGASSHGATDPEFTLLDIYDILRREGICDAAPAAVSLGGDRDVGMEFEAGIKDSLARKIRESGNFLLYEPDLVKNVSERMRLYERAAGGRISAFINSGGGYANLGTSLRALDVPPGLNRTLALPNPSERGVLFEMAARNVPVVHLLFIKGLAAQSGLPWDPIPLPRPGLLHLPETKHTSGFWILAAAYFSLLSLLAAWRR